MIEEQQQEIDKQRELLEEKDILLKSKDSQLKQKDLQIIEIQKNAIKNMLRENIEPEKIAAIMSCDISYIEKIMQE